MAASETGKAPERDLDKLDEALQFRIVNIVDRFYNLPISAAWEHVSVDPKRWAYRYGDALRLQDHATYALALAWFFASVRPTNALSSLVNAKKAIIADREMWELLMKRVDDEIRAYEKDTSNGGN